MTIHLVGDHLKILQTIVRSAYIAAPENAADCAWYLDSGATNHITNSLSNLNTGAPYKGSDKLVVGNRQQLIISHVGDALLPTHSQNTKHLYLKYALYVPEITKNLISISKLLSDNEINVEFYNNVCLVEEKNQGRALLEGVAKGGLYQLQCYPINPSKV